VPLPSELELFMMETIHGRAFLGVFAAVTTFALTACGGPSAAKICAELKLEGVADKCTPGTASAAGAKEQVNFELVGKSGKKGEIITFGSGPDTDAAAKAYKAKYPAAYVKWTPKKQFLVYADMSPSDVQSEKFQQVLGNLTKK
jgi:hypothetical protein